MAVRQAKPPRAEKKLNKISKPKIKSENKVLLVAQEIKFAKTLAGNDKKARDKVLKNLKKWLTYRSASSFEFSEHDFMRLWKGLFYCVWMSDKPLVQEDLCESISALLDCFGNEKIETSALFYKCFLKTMAADWFGIDQHRIDKFLMLVRRMTRGILRCGQRLDWSPQSLSAISFSVGALLKETNSLGLQMHLADLWMEEVAKVSAGTISPEVVGELTRAFAEYLCYGQETRLAGSIMRHIFTHLIRQTDLGIDYTEKLNAWKHAGYPGGSIDAMTKVEYSDEEEEEPDEPEQDDEEDGDSDEDNGQPKRKVGLDARAGHVDAVLPQLTVDGELMATMLKNMITDARSTLSNRSKLKGLVQAFETLASGEYPYKMKETTMPDDPKFRLPKAMKSAVDLMVFEEMHEDAEMKGMNKRQRRKYLMKQRKLEEAKGADEEDEEEAPQLLSPSAPKKAKKDNVHSKKADTGVWHVEDVKDTEDVRPDSSKNKIFVEGNSTVKKGKKSKNERKRLKKKSNNDRATEEPKKTTPEIKKEKRTDTNASLKESADASIKETPVKNSATPKKTDKTKATAKKAKKDIINGVLSEDIGKHSPKGTPKTPKISAASTPKKTNNLKLNAESAKVNNLSGLINEVAKKNTSTKRDSPIVMLTPKLEKSIVQTHKKGDKILENFKTRKSIDNLSNTPNKATAVAKSPKSAKKDLPTFLISALKREKITTTENGETEILIKKTHTKKLIAKDRLNTSDSGVLKSQKNRLNILKANLSLTSSPARKKVMIALKNNTSQHVIDYFKSVKQSPEIPFDGLKRPSKTALKPNTLPSPINPFYKKKLKLNF